MIRVCIRIVYMFLLSFEFYRASTLERASIRKPIEVAQETVRALRSDAGYVAVPWYYLTAAKLYQ